jgi:hypothetical protein
VAVREVLLRAANAGLSTYKGEIVGTGDWPAIVDPDTYAAVKAILTDASRRRGVGKPPTTLLAGVLKCGKCGGRMNGGFRGVAEDGSLRLNYRCRACYLSRARRPLDELVSEAVIQHVEASAGTLTRPRKAAPRAVAKAISEAGQLRGQIDGYQARAAEFDPADLAGILRGLRARLAKAEAKIVKDAGKPASYALVSSGDVQAAWIAAGTEGQRTVIGEQVEKIVIGAPGRPDAEVFWRKDD